MRCESTVSRSNAFSSDVYSSSLFSCGTTSGFLSSAENEAMNLCVSVFGMDVRLPMLEWLPMLRLSGSALPLSGSVVVVSLQPPVLPCWEVKWN